LAYAALLWVRFRLKQVLKVLDIRLRNFHWHRGTTTHSTVIVAASLYGAQDYFCPRIKPQKAREGRIQPRSGVYVRVVPWQSLIQIRLRREPLRILNDLVDAIEWRTVGGAKWTIVWWLKPTAKNSTNCEE
jgi:hypothetical protein